MSKNPFSPLRQLDSVCHQQARCCVHLPVIKEVKIWPVAPVPEPPVSQVSFPAPFSAVPCHWCDGGKHHLWPWSLNQSPQCPEVPFDGLRTSLCYLVPAILPYQMQTPHKTACILPEICKNVWALVGNSSVSSKCWQSHQVPGKNDTVSHFKGGTKGRQDA